MACKVEHGHSVQLPQLNGADQALRAAEVARNVPLAQAGTQSRLSQLITQIPDEATTQVRRLTHGCHASAHAAILRTDDYDPLTTALWARTNVTGLTANHGL